MRRDLNRGCAVCRLRFSSQLTSCPVCRGAPLAVNEAIQQVQPTSRAAWFAKWIIVLSCFPAIYLVAAAGSILLKEGWPPKSALDIVMYVLGAAGTCLGASLAVAIPLAIWFGVIAAIRFLLKFIVERPRRSLRISIETKMRPVVREQMHIMHRLWDFIEKLIDKLLNNPKRVIFLLGGLFLVLQVFAEIFGETPILKFTSLEDFGKSLVVLLVINGMASLVIPLFWGVFTWFGTTALHFLRKPPNLFGFDARPPEVKNDEVLQTLSKDRTEIIGHVAKLSLAEKEALGHEVKDELVAPLSGQTCLAFRITGDADGQPVDDADATHFALITNDQKRCVVQVHDVIVDLPTDTKIREDSARGFLRKRGLRENDLSLKESVLRDGDRIQVRGRTVDLRVGTAGYRGDDRRMLVDAGDGLPVLIQAVESALT